MDLEKGKAFPKRIPFIDESKYTIFDNGSRSRVWRKLNTALDVKNIKNAVKQSGGSVAVGDSMASSGVGRLVF